MDLLEIYRSMLRYAGLEADANGYISTAVAEERKDPTIVDGARLVLPTRNQLQKFDPKEKIIFHPLLENIIHGESSVTKKLTDCINIRLNYTIGHVAQSLLNLLASPEFHSKLTPDQAELLTSVKDVDEKSVSNFMAIILHGLKTKPDRLFSHIYLKRRGHKGKEVFSRLAVVSFPFYENIANEKIRQKDKQAYKELFEFMFPTIKEPDSYNYGSNSRIAPCADALMMSSVGIASALNDMLETYKEFIIDYSDHLKFDDYWLDYFGNLEELRNEIRKIPLHVGMNGGHTPASEVPVETVTTPLSQPVQAAPAASTPVTTFPTPQTTRAPQLTKTERGLDFHSIVATTPAVAATPNPLNIPGQQFMSPWAGQMPMSGMPAQHVPMFAGGPGLQYPGMQPMGNQPFGMVQQPFGYGNVPLI